jgi:hypothetical protein
VTEPQRELLQRILASRQFAYTDALKRVLQYVCVNAGTPDAAPLKEYQVAVEALNRPASFDPKLDPVVRVSMTEIRERLKAYFETEGRAERIRLNIPKGQYRAVFEEAPPAADNGDTGRSAAPSVARFWRPYLAPGARNILLYTEPLFFRDDEHGVYIRNLYVNERASGLEEIRKKDPDLAARDIRPCYHYLSTGEVNCMFGLVRLFFELGAPLELRNARTSFWSELRNANLIMLGATRTNTFMDAMQGDTPISLHEDCISVADPLPGEQSCYRGSRRREGKLPCLTEYALVARRPGPSPASAITTISANHGKAIQGAGHFLTLENQTARLLGSLDAVDFESAAPFQTVFRVDMIDLDDEVVNVEPVAWRPRQR